MSRNKKLIDKQAKKIIDGKCYFCPNDNYSVFDVHRIVPGEEGGEYTEHNTITVCACCHRLIHSGEIMVDRKYLSTSGKWVLHYWKDGEEYWD